MISLAASLSTSKKGYGREDGYTIHALLLVQCFCVLHQVLRTSIRITAARHTIRSRGQGHSAGDAEHEKAEASCRHSTPSSLTHGDKGGNQSNRHACGWAWWLDSYNLCIGRKRGRERNVYSCVYAYVCMYV